MVGFEITCANMNPNGMLTRVGGVNWSLGIQEAINKLITGQLRLYVRVDNELVDIEVRGEGASAHLALATDGSPLHTLNDLPSC
jgi:hypothetical protein